MAPQPIVGARRGRGGGGGGQRPGERGSPLPPPVLADRAGVSGELLQSGVGAVPGPSPAPGNSSACPGALRALGIAGSRLAGTLPRP